MQQTDSYILHLLKQNAYPVFVQYSAQQTIKVNQELADLRLLYKHEENTTKREEILVRVEKLKKRLQELEVNPTVEGKAQPT